MEPTETFVAYRSRWLVLLAVYSITVSSNILWISFATVNTVAAGYFNKSPAAVDMLTTISFVIGMPMCILSTYLVKKWGLK